jgi:hypothetical protein
MWVFVIYFFHILSHDIHSFDFNKHLSPFPLISSLVHSFFVSKTFFQSLFFETFLFYFLSCFFAKTFQHMMFWRTSKHCQTFFFLFVKDGSLVFLFCCQSFLCYVLYAWFVDLCRTKTHMILKDFGHWPRPFVFSLWIRAFLFTLLLSQFFVNFVCMWFVLI